MVGCGGGGYVGLFSLILVASVLVLWELSRWRGGGDSGLMWVVDDYSSSGPAGSLRFDPTSGHGDVNCGGVVDLWDDY